MLDPRPVLRWYQKQGALGNNLIFTKYAAPLGLILKSKAGWANRFWIGEGSNYERLKSEPCPGIFPFG